MKEIQLCRQCVNLSTRPNVSINADGICSVCEYFHTGADWDTRNAEIQEICQWGRENTKSSYDCIVTVSGGKDSMRQAFFARDNLGLNPLLVSAVYPPEQLHERGAKNLENLISHGFDCVTLSLNPQIYKQLMRTCIDRFGNICNHSEMSLYAIPIHAAIAYQIPLVFLGENPAQTIGEKHGRLDGDASQMRHANTLMGGNADRFLDDKIGPQDLHFYNYPADTDVQKAKLRIIYLGYYIEDWSGKNNAEFAISKGLQTREDAPENTGDLWGVSAVDEDFRIVNQHIKYLKFGFGHVTDQVMERIHAGKITREEGLKLVEQFDQGCGDHYIEKLADFLEMPPEALRKKIEKTRSLDIWSQNKDGNWALNRGFYRPEQVKEKAANG